MQVAESAVDPQLDHVARGIAKAALLAVGDDVTSPRYLRYLRYFADMPTSIIRLGLEDDQVIERRRKATAARRDHRVRVIAALIDDINNARFSLYGSLTRKVGEQRLPRDWPDCFFRHGSRSAKDGPAPLCPSTAQPAASVASSYPEACRAARGGLALPLHLVVEVRAGEPGGVAAGNGPRMTGSICVGCGAGAPPRGNLIP